MAEQPDPEDLDISDELAELTEELVGDAPPALAFLARLFALAEGQWHPIRVLVAELGEVARKVGITEDAYRITLHAMWKGCVPTAHGKGWAVLVFYSPEWHGVANTILVNRNELELYRN